MCALCEPLLHGIDGCAPRASWTLQCWQRGQPHLVRAAGPSIVTLECEELHLLYNIEACILNNFLRYETNGVVSLLGVVL